MRAHNNFASIRQALFTNVRAPSSFGTHAFQAEFRCTTQFWSSHHWYTRLEQLQIHFLIRSLSPSPGTELGAEAQQVDQGWPRPPRATPESDEADIKQDKRPQHSDKEFASLLKSTCWNAKCAPTQTKGMSKVRSCTGIREKDNSTQSRRKSFHLSHQNYEHVEPRKRPGSGSSFLP